MRIINYPRNNEQVVLLIKISIFFLFLFRIVTEIFFIKQNKFRLQRFLFQAQYVKSRKEMDYSWLQKKYFGHSYQMMYIFLISTKESTVDIHLFLAEIFTLVDGHYFMKHSKIVQSRHYFFSREYKALINVPFRYTNLVY